MFGEAWISSKYDVDHIFGLLKPVRIFFVIIIVLLACLLLGRFWQWRFERLVDECTLEHRVVALWVDVGSP